MPRQTRETALPKPPVQPIEWEKIARSGRVWEFIEGEDFNGNASGFRARAKRAARNCGVDFDHIEVKRGDKTVLKVLARMIPQEQRPGTAAQANGVAVRSETVATGAAAVD